MRQFIFFTFLLFTTAYTTVSAQSVTLELPFHKGKSVSITSWSGIKTDTVAQGIIDGNTGMCQLPLKASPGIYALHIQPDKNFDFIWSGKENITISCPGEYIHGQNTVFRNSPENDSMSTWFKQQYILQQKKELTRAGTSLYDSLSVQYRFFKQEMESLETQRLALSRQIDGSPLYAAKYTQLRNFMERTTPPLIESVQNKAACEPFRNYYRDSLDMEALYTSGMWYQVINTSLELYRQKGEYQMEGVFKGHFAEDITHILSRTQSQEVYEALVHDVVVMCEQFDWKQDAIDIIGFVVKDGRITHPQGIIKTAMELFRLQPGNPAPKIAGLRKGAETATLLVFYESGCNNCENEIGMLKGNYSLLKEKGIRVVSISSDDSKEVFEYHSKNFPWPDKLCDFKGAKGKNFKNYGIIGTPTLFLIDKEGKIVGRYARLIDTNLLK